ARRPRRLCPPYKFGFPREPEPARFRVPGRDAWLWNGAAVGPLSHMGGCLENMSLLAVNSPVPGRPGDPTPPPLRDPPDRPRHDPPADPTHEPEQPFGDPTPTPGGDPPDKIPPQQRS